MAASDVLIACVGKPSAGKSSFLNAVSDASAKVGNYPFTTIKPNRGVAYVPIDCACKRFGKEKLCKPRYGRCVDGTRWVPIEMLDVAGLVPGASEGKGLGNQFLDDLRTADALIHVVDVSGTTDSHGKETVGYDPINDVEWLTGEIEAWIYNNLKTKWSSTMRRHVAVHADPAFTLQQQLSGYGVRLPLVLSVLDKLRQVLTSPDHPTPYTKDVIAALESWDDEVLRTFVKMFVEEKFPTVIALNKIDLPDAAKNIDKICRKYDESRTVLTSALAETFLRRLAKQGFIRYHEGTDRFDTAEDDESGAVEGGQKLKTMDEKTRSRLEKVQDLVLFRYGTTGVLSVLTTAIKLLHLVPAYPVKNIHNFSGGGHGGGVFRDCLLLRPGTTVREFARKVHPEIDRCYLWAEGVGGVRLGEDDIVTAANNVISFKTSQEITRKEDGGGGR
ncbi:45.2 kDa GTP-binding protein [Gonapodya prolifera JEL478]|uniref:45.2 kDa GTP-binding protein n=1 Tax=Gonapodya prolifera (strain JEL478) TaxID=1344416 RepID=A0A139AIJ1_GONPJ|nr:45.2 kDa GTP-binding protein [Gonapodya prolifera JEL478]|eukprot:KXS16600.1 45.2 kDa GTP-binding protein [Gonapodya prolifera JEL478]